MLTTFRPMHPAILGQSIGINPTLHCIHYGTPKPSFAISTPVTCYIDDGTPRVSGGTRPLPSQLNLFSMTTPTPPQQLQQSLESSIIQYLGYLKSPTANIEQALDIIYSELETLHKLFDYLEKYFNIFKKMHECEFGYQSRNILATWTKKYTSFLVEKIDRWDYFFERAQVTLFNQIDLLSRNSTIHLVPQKFDSFYDELIQSTHPITRIARNNLLATLNNLLLANEDQTILAHSTQLISLIKGNSNPKVPQIARLLINQLTPILHNSHPILHTLRAIVNRPKNIKQTIISELKQEIAYHHKDTDHLISKLKDWIACADMGQSIFGEARRLINFLDSLDDDFFYYQRTIPIYGRMASDLIQRVYSWRNQWYPLDID